MEKEYQEKLPEIVNFLTAAISIESYDLCFCGSGKKLRECCKKNGKGEILWAYINFKKLDKYKNSQENDLIKNIPAGLWNQLYYKSANRLKCLYSKCDSTTTVCHSIPANTLKKSFGAYCLEFNKKKFESTGTQKKAGVEKVFCNQHDGLFNSIDILQQIDWVNKEHLFLLCFKTIPFSLRKIQILLGIDSQVEIYRPILIANRIKKGNYTLDLTNLQEQYNRFEAAFSFFDKVNKAFKKKNWDYFKYYHRIIKSDQKIFFADWLNPSHDLGGKRLNNPKIPIALTCNIFSKNNKIHILIGVPSGKSQEAYMKLLDQIKKVDDDIFKIIINNFMTISSNSPLLPMDHKNIPDCQKIKEAKSELGASLKQDSNLVFDLTIPRVNFIDD